MLTTGWSLLLESHFKAHVVEKWVSHDQSLTHESRKHEISRSFLAASLISKLTSRKYENPEWPATSCLFYDLRGYIAINCAPEHMLD